MMGEMSIDDWDEKSGKKKENDEDEVDGMKQEVDSKGKVVHVEMSDLRFLKRKLIGCAKNAGPENDGPNRRTWKCRT